VEMASRVNNPHGGGCGLAERVLEKEVLAVPCGVHLDAFVGQPRECCDLWGACPAGEAVDDLLPGHVVAVLVSADAHRYEGADSGGCGCASNQFGEPVVVDPRGDGVDEAVRCLVVVRFRQRVVEALAVSFASDSHPSNRPLGLGDSPPILLDVFPRVGVEESIAVGSFARPAP
jgi:hypothetical protein